MSKGLTSDDKLRDFDTLSRIYHSLPVTERVAWMRQHSIEWNRAVQKKQAEARGSAQKKI